MARGLGCRLESVDALSEFRVYVGLWLATAACLMIALRRVEEAGLGDLLVVRPSSGRGGPGSEAS
jgi:hypothetical protein